MVICCGLDNKGAGFQGKEKTRIRKRLRLKVKGVDKKTTTSALDCVERFAVGIDDRCVESTVAAALNTIDCSYRQMGGISSSVAINRVQGKGQTKVKNNYNANNNSNNKNKNKNIIILIII